MNLWRSPYAPARLCPHEMIIDVLPPLVHTPDWSKPLGGFPLRVREWVCGDCGTERDPHDYHIELGARVGYLRCETTNGGERRAQPANRREKHEPRRHRPRRKDATCTTTRR